MADDPSNPNPAPSNETTPAANPPEDKTQSATPSSTTDATKMAEELGKLKAENEALKVYQTQVDPVIQTIWSDQELLKKATEVHNKRLGITPDNNLKGNGEIIPEKSPEIAKVEKKVDEVRNTEIVNKINAFYTRKGMDKLDEDTKQNLNIKIGAVLMEMLDPMGNKKELKEALEDVPLPKLDKFLDNAYDLATKTEQLDQAKNEGKQESSAQNLGIIGSLPSQSSSSDNVSLSSLERKIAGNMGITEEKWLARKKEIASRGNIIY